MGRTRAITFTSCMLLLLSLTGQAAPDSSQVQIENHFGRDLVNKVKKGAVYIWAMAPNDLGFLQPAWIGSGVIFQAVPEENAAYALTNHHVVNGTAILQVEGWDHSTYKADMVATEPGIDVGLIKIYNIPPDHYEVCVLGDSDAIQIGEPALAIGAPGSGDSVNTDRSNPMISFGLHQTTTMRVVAGIETDPIFYMSFWAGERTSLGRQVFTNIPYAIFCQTAINGGNSGGPLYNSRGEVIGLNHATMGSAGPIAQNGNYTIPINFAKTFAYQILNNQTYEIPWLGLDMLMPPQYQTGQQINEFVERNYDPKTLRVLGVRRDSAAERAGFRTGDVILEFDGQVFPTVIDLRIYVFKLQIGRSVPVLVRRGREKIELSVEVQPKRGYDSEFSL